MLTNLKQVSASSGHKEDGDNEESNEITEENSENAEDDNQPKNIEKKLEEPTKSNIQTGHPIKTCQNTTLQAPEDQIIENEKPENNSTTEKKVLVQNRTMTL